MLWRLLIIVDGLAYSTGIAIPDVNEGPLNAYDPVSRVITCVSKVPLRNSTRLMRFIIYSEHLSLGVDST